MKTFNAKPKDIIKNWYLINAEGKTLGRIATKISTILRGKNKTIYTPHVDTGDFVIVINAKKVKVTGNKISNKKYYKHSQYPGGLKSITLEKLIDTHPTRVIQHAVKGMLPKGPLGKIFFSKLKVYEGSEHPHVAQQPEIIEV